MNIRLNTRPAVLFGLMLVIALIAFLPLRLAAGWLALDDDGLSARRVTGTVWWGGMDEARFGQVALGDVDAGLSPIQLLAGRARVDLAGRADAPGQRLRGALGLTRNSTGVDDVTAHLPMADALAPLPVTAIDLDDVSVRFEQGLCVKAEGRVQASIAGAVPQLTLPATMSGPARCESGALMFDLTGSAQTESITVTLRQNGRFHAVLSVPRPGDQTSAAALTAAGFRDGPRGLQLSIDGRF